MLAVFLGLAASLSWGVHDFIARFASRGFGFMNTVFGVAVAGFVLVTVALLAIEGTIIVTTAALWLTVVTGAGYALATLCIFAALTYGRIALVSPIVGSYPATALAIGVALGKMPSMEQWIIFAAITAGVIIVAASCRGEPQDDAASEGAIVVPNASTAIAYALGSNLCFAISISAGQEAATIVGDLTATWYARCFGLATIAALFLIRAKRPSVPINWLPAVIVVAALDSLALLTILAAGNTDNALAATTISSTFGVVTIILAAIFLRERMSLVQWLGVVMIFAGVARLISLG